MPSLAYFSRFPTSRTLVEADTNETHVVVVPYCAYSDQSDSRRVKSSQKRVEIKNASESNRTPEQTRRRRTERHTWESLYLEPMYNQWTIVKETCNRIRLERKRVEMWLRKYLGVYCTFSEALDLRHLRSANINYISYLADTKSQCVRVSKVINSKGRIRIEHY